MKRIAILSLFLLGTFLMGQQYNVPSVPAAGGGPGLSLLLDMDFDGSGCVDSGSAEDCTTGGGANPDCNAGHCPIDASTYSLGLDATSELCYDDELSAITTGWVTLDFRGHFDDTSDTIAQVGGLISAENNYECRLRVKTGALDSYANGGANDPTDITISNGTLYYLRLTYDIPNDECMLRVSTSDFGGEDVGTALSSGSSAGSVAGWEFRQDATHTGGFEFDDVTMCSGNAGSTQGRCNE